MDCSRSGAEEYMSLLCFKNGSLSRERICKQYCNGSWDIFNKALKETPPGNYGNIGIYFDEMEILPNAVGVYRWDANNVSVSEFSSAVECRAIIEGQFMAKKYHAMKFGFKPGKLSRVLATGGASKNIEILKILSNVMNCKVYVLNETSSSACLGSIYNSHLSILNESFKKENDKLEEHINDKRDVQTKQEENVAENKERAFEKKENLNVELITTMQSAEDVTKAIKNESVEPDKMKVDTTTIKDSTEQQQVLRNQTADNKKHFIPKDIYFEFIKTLPPYELACEPDPNSVEIYRKLLERYASLEASLISVDVCE